MTRAERLGSFAFALWSLRVTGEGTIDEWLKLWPSIDEADRRMWSEIACEIAGIATNATCNFLKDQLESLATSFTDEAVAVPLEVPKVSA